MMKTFWTPSVLILIFSFISNDLSAQNLQWAKRMGGTANDYVQQVAVDASGFVYTTGSFKDTVDFDPGPGVYNLISPAAEDIFISKLDANGNFVWALSMGNSAGNDRGVALAFDPAGYLVIAGYFADSVDFDPGPGTYYLKSGLGGNDVFVLKLDLSGNFIWAGKLGGYNGDSVREMQLDADGNVVLTGQFFTSADFDPGPAQFNIPTSGIASHTNGS